MFPLQRHLVELDDGDKSNVKVPQQCTYTIIIASAYLLSFYSHLISRHPGRRTGRDDQLISGSFQKWYKPELGLLLGAGF